jgi:hypothetical protein
LAFAGAAGRHWAAGLGLQRMKLSQASFLPEIDGAEPPGPIADCDWPKSGGWETRGMTAAEKIEFYSIPEPNSGCWLWLGSLWKGYGRLQLNGRSQKAYRVAWRAFRGVVPQGLHVLHRCDVRCCVNPDHLFLGTNHDNVTDMVKKRRHLSRIRPGESHSAAKLDENKVRRIRDGAERGVDLAEEFGVTPTLIWMVRHYKAWRHLP